MTGDDCFDGVLLAAYELAADDLFKPVLSKHETAIKRIAIDSEHDRINLVLSSRVRLSAKPVEGVDVRVRASQTVFDIERGFAAALNLGDLYDRRAIEARMEPVKTDSIDLDTLCDWEVAQVIIRGISHKFYEAVEEVSPFVAAFRRDEAFGVNDNRASGVTLT